MKRRYIVLLCIIICALGLRLYKLSWPILICDELSSVLWWIDLSFPGKILRSAIIEPSPPLYFIILHSWIKLFGATEFSIRFLSVLMGLLSIIVLYRIGKELIDTRTGIGAALFMAISPYHLFYSTYARMYSLVLFLTLLSWYFFIKLLKKSHRKWAWLYILPTALSLYTHYSAVYTILVQNIYFFIFWKDNRKIARLWISSLIWTIILSLPLTPIFLKDIFFSEWGLKTIKAVPFFSKLLSIKYIFIDSFMPCIGQTYFDYSMEDIYTSRLLKWILHPLFLMTALNLLISITFIIFFVSGLVYLFRDNKKNFALLSVYLFPLFFLILFIFRYNRPRFFFQVCPAFYLIVTCGLATVRGKIKVLSIAVLLFFHFIALNVYYSQIKISPVKPAFSYLNASYQKGDIILINSPDVRNWGTNFWYHNRFQNSSLFDIRLLKWREKAKAVKSKNPFLQKLKNIAHYHNVEDIFRTITLDEAGKKKRIWYVGDENRSTMGKNEKIIEALKAKSFTTHSFKDFGNARLYLLQK